jgi:hypothetical protein
MTMDEISELVKAVKDTAKPHDNTVTENKGNFSFISTRQNLSIYHKEPPPPPPAPQQQEPQQQQQQQPNEFSSTAMMSKLDVSPLPPLVPISPRQEALGMMADKKRQKWMREKGKNFIKLNLYWSFIFQLKWIE